MPDWNDAYKVIAASQNPTELQNMQFNPPGPGDTILNLMGVRINGQYNPAAIEQYKQAKIAELENKAALPIKQKLADFAAEGWSSDPSISGKDWATGLLQQSGTKIDPNNPYEMQAIEQFANQAQTEKSYANQLERMGANVNDAGSLARFALNPDVTPHLKTLETAPTTFMPEYGTKSPALRDFMSKAYQAYSDSGTLDDFLRTSGKLLSTTNANPKDAAKIIQDMAKNYKETKAPVLNDYNTFYRGFAYKHPQLSGGALDDAAAKAWHTMKVAEGTAIGQNRIPAITLVPGAFDAEGNPITFNRRTGTVSPAKNPIQLDVGKGRAEQKSYENLQKITGMVRSNEIEANKNFDQLATLMNRLGNGTIPIINNVINRLKNNLGAPEPGTAEGVAYEAMTQYARVVNKQTGGAAVTDTARKEALNLLNVLKMNPRQFAQKLQQYRITMQNAVKSQQEAMDQARTARSKQAPQIAPEGTRARLKDGRIVTSDGKGGWE